MKKTLLALSVALAVLGALLLGCPAIAPIPDLLDAGDPSAPFLADGAAPHRVGAGIAPTGSGPYYGTNGIPSTSALGWGADGQVLCSNGTIGGWCAPSQVTAPDTVFQFVNASSDVGGYFVLDDVAPGSAGDLSAASATSTKVLIKAFATPLGEPNITVIPAGPWNFAANGYVSATGAFTCNIVFDVYKRAAGGTETQIFTTTSGNITALSTTAVTASYYQSTDTTMLVNDRIVTKASALCTLTGATVHFVFGNTNPSYIETPLSGAAIEVGGDCNGPSGSITCTKMNGSGGSSGQTVVSNGTSLSVGAPNFGTQSLTCGVITGGTAAGINALTGGLDLTTKTFSTTGTIDTTTTDAIILADTTSAGFTLTLPAHVAGRTLFIKDKKQTWATNNLTLARAGGTGKIDGASASLVLSIGNAALALYDDGTDWYTTKVITDFGANGLATTGTLSAGATTVTSLTTNTLAYASGNPPECGRIQLTYSSDADKVLAAGEYNNCRIAIASGSTLTIDRKLLFPIGSGSTLGQGWTVFNGSGVRLNLIGTTNGSTSTGVGVSCPNSARCQVETNGTNLIATSISVYGSGYIPSDFGWANTTSAISAIQSDEVCFATNSSWKACSGIGTLKWTDATTWQTILTYTPSAGVEDDDFFVLVNAHDYSGFNDGGLSTDSGATGSYSTLNFVKFNLEVHVQTLNLLTDAGVGTQLYLCAQSANPCLQTATASLAPLAISDCHGCANAKDTTSCTCGSTTTWTAQAVVSGASVLIQVQATGTSAGDLWEGTAQPTNQTNTYR